MSKSQLKLSQLKALAAVADCGNFGEAAWQLGLTQPTVSHAIATLEDELGVILLFRGRHGAHLTPAGAAVLQPVREILRLLDVVHQEASLHRGLDGGQVRIATFRSAAANLLPEIVAQFQTDCPAIEVSITEFYDYTYVEQQVRDGKADIGVTFLPTAEDFEAWPLMRDPYLVLVPPDFQAEASQPDPSTAVTWNQLTTWPLILYPEDNSCFVQVQSYFQAAGHRLEPRYQFRETTTIVSMVAQGLGVAIVPALSAKSIPTGVQRRELPTPLERQVGVILLAGALHPPAVFAFLNTLRTTQSHTPELNTP